MPGAAATLLDDGGAAASDEAHFFRSPSFLRAEGTTHSLVVEGASELALPVIVREIPGTDALDAISPYGYPGARSSGPPPDPAEVDWSATGLVSLFVRDRVGDPPAFAGGTERAQVQIADPAQPSGVRKRLREQIRRNERRGWSIGVEPGTEAAPEDRAAFERAYAETMARTGAADRYLYESSYFEGLLGAEGAWLVLAGRESEQPLCGCDRRRQRRLPALLPRRNGRRRARRLADEEPVRVDDLAGRRAGPVPEPRGRDRAR